MIIIRSCLLAAKSHRSLCVSFSRIAAELCIYHWFVWSNLNFMHISQGITLPTKSCLVLYSCANWLHSLITWLMVSSLSTHNLQLLFCCVLSILALIWLVLMVLFCVAIRRDSVSLLKFPFLSHVQVFSCEMFISRVVCLVSDGRYQSSFVFFYVVLESYRCVNTVFSASNSSSSRLFWYIKSVNVVSGMYCHMHGH